MKFDNKKFDQFFEMMKFIICRISTMKMIKIEAMSHTSRLNSFFLYKLISRNRNLQSKLIILSLFYQISPFFFIDQKIKKICPFFLKQMFGLQRQKGI